MPKADPPPAGNPRVLGSIQTLLVEDMPAGLFNPRDGAGRLFGIEVTCQDDRMRPRLQGRDQRINLCDANICPCKIIVKAHA